MSSYILSSKHFNSVEKGLQVLFNNRDFHSYGIKHLYPDLYEGKKIEKTLSGIMDIIRSLTCKCVTLQYANRYEGKIDQEIEEQTADLIKNKTKYVMLEGVALYKALTSMTYQIEIQHLDEVTEEEKKVMEFIETMESLLAKHIVSRSDAYEKAKWEIS